MVFAFNLAFMTCTTNKSFIIKLNATNKISGSGINKNEI